MRRFIRRTLLGLGRDQRGTSLIEFAFTAPIFAVLLVGVADLARGFSERYKLQQAVNRTLELGRLGSTDQDYNFLMAKAADAAGVPAGNVTLVSWLMCDTTRRAYTEECAEGEQISRYVTLTINSTFAPSFGTMGYPGAANGVVPIRASASMRVQ